MESIYYFSTNAEPCDLRLADTCNGATAVCAFNALCLVPFLRAVNDRERRVTWAYLMRGALFFLRAVNCSDAYP